MLSTALRLLLYVDEVVVESDVIDPFMDLREEIEIDRPAIRDALTRLALIRPLVLVGAIRFAGRWRSLYGGRAVGYSMAMGEVPESEWGTATEDEFLKVRHELPYLLASSLLLVEEEKATPLARSRAEQVALEALFNDHQIDGRLSLLNTLARFPVPNFGGDPAILVNLRSRSDAFADWRVHLGNALSVITDLPESPRAIAEAQGVLSSELTRQLAKVKAEVEGSSALRAVSDGVKRLGFAGIGTATGAVVANTMGPSIVGPLAAAATAHSAHTISDYLRERQSRGAAKAIWDVALTFTDS